MTRFVVQLRLRSAEQKTAWEEEARRQGLGLSAYIRRCVEEDIELRRSTEEKGDEREQLIRSAVPAIQLAAVKPSKSRKEMCIHRNPPETICSRCGE